VIKSSGVKRINWPLWTGFLLAFFAVLSYELIFVEWPITRNFPWANLLLSAGALVLLVIGVRRAFRPGRRLISKIIAPVVATLAVLVIGLFIFITLIQSRWLPASPTAPAVGQKAPEFTLTDTNGQPVTLASLLSQPVDNQPPKGALLIFYRGYW